jgi:hypothetical protein
MAAVVAIYLVGLALCLLAGVAMGGLLRPGGRWVGIETLPLGMCTLVTLLYPLGMVMPGSRAAPVALGVVVAAIALALALRMRAGRAEGAGLRLRATLTPDLPEAVVIAGGGLLGLLLLAPVLQQRFPTTIAATNNDGWGYAGMVDWLKRHPFPRDVQPDIAHPLTLIPWNTGSHGFGFGFEHFAAMLATLLDRQGFEVVNIAAAVALASSIGGWALLAKALGSRLGPGEAALVGVVSASPLLLMPFAENYTTQFMSLCLWPFAVAAFARFATEPAWRTLLVAAVGVGAVVGVYPSLAPLLVLPVVLLALLSPGHPAWVGTRATRIAGARPVARIGRAAVLCAALAVAVPALALVQVMRAVDNLRELDAATVEFGALFSREAYAAFFVGAQSGFGLYPRLPLAWATIAGLVLLLVVYAVALAPRRASRAAGAPITLLAGGILLTAAAVVVQYGVRDERPYQVYKGLMSAGALASGLVVLGLVAAWAGRSRTVPILAAALAALWIPVGASVLEAAGDGATGFRAADVQMGRALDDLPPGSTVLAGGAGAEARSFQFRMMAAYFGDHAPHHTVIGVGTTASYLSGGGAPEWRPARPWTHVLTIRPEPVATGRVPTWTNGAYALDSAPELDVTTYGSNWYPSETVGDEVWAWTSGAAELVVMNRGATRRRVRLEMDVVSYARPRTLTLRAGGRALSARMGARGTTTVALPLDLPPGGVVPVSLNARPAASLAPPPDGRPLLLRIQGLRVG